MAQDDLRANGFFTESVTAKVDGQEYYGFTEIGNYKATIEEKILAGKNGVIRGRTRGVRKPPEKMKLVGPPDTMRRLYNALAAKAADRRPSSVQFPITIVITDNGTPHTDVLKRCRVLGWDTKIPPMESADAALEEVEIQPLDIERDGKPL